MDRRSLAAELADIAAWAGPVERRAQAMLEPLHRAVPYDAAWIAVRDPETRSITRSRSMVTLTPCSATSPCPRPTPRSRPWG
jgi:hypothetical protein